MRSPRIALKEPAARGLKTWAAIEGREPAAILEELVMANLPPKVKELIGSEEPRSQGAPEPLECKKEGEGIICIPAALTPEARAALTYILEELEAGREPTSREAAEKVGLTPTGLGMELSRHGIKAKNTRREMKAVKIYVKPMKAMIKDILEKS
jgi:hypothetical protein